MVDTFTEFFFKSIGLPVTRFVFVGCKGGFQVEVLEIGPRSSIGT